MNNKVAIVTGSTKGIGRSIAEELCKKGFRVVITSRTLEAATKVADEIEQAVLGSLSLQARQLVGLEFNIERKTDLSDLVEKTINIFGRLDVLVNNALSNKSVLPCRNLSDNEIELALTENITHNLLLSRMVYPHLKETHGCIINIGSATSNQYLLTLPLYVIIKGAISQMTKVLAAEWADDGIRVNSINPGFIRTSAFYEFGMSEEVVNQSYDFYKKYHALGRVGEPVDIGKLAAYLASDDANFITGSIFDVDGGYSVKGHPLYRPGATAVESLV